MSPLEVFLTKDSGCLDVALGARDSYTAAHCTRVEAMCLMLGQECSLDGDELILLRIAAKLHDIGKIGIPDRVLLKPSRFEPDEWEVMKSHAVLGQEICAAMPHEAAPEAAFIIRHHHEGFDGKGYPDGLSGEDIPVAARLITIIDCYDAMTTTRPYHVPRSHDAVMSIMDGEKGSKLDPYILRRFERVIAHSEFRVA